MNCGVAEEKQAAHSHLSLCFSHSPFVVQVLVSFSLGCLVLTRKCLGTVSLLG